LESTVSRKPVELPGARIGALAVLPLFMNLHGKRVLVAGADEGAEWKAELLAAAGAEVHRVIEIPSRWPTGLFTGLALAVASAADDAEAARFHAAGKAAGVPVSVIDRPAFSDVQFGSIVNRSPVVIGISTAGTAPVLGQAIRQRIEAAVPQFTGAWAAIAGRLRSRVKALYPTPERRRAFWRGFADRALLAPPDETAEAEMLSVAVTRGSGGKVTLVGAGPGDAELLTLKAVRALQSADIILFDDLVSAEVLDLARREARRMLVGKRGGGPSCRQDEINALMLRLARQGKHVVRLKSGDPMIFGRAGEEIDELQAAGITVEVVPGITAALAAASALQVSLTHRDMARSVRFLTGHAKDGALPADIDWDCIARDRQATLMVYMAGRTSAALVNRLTAAGMSPGMPVALIAGASRPTQAIWRGRLDEMPAKAVGFGDGQPLLLGIGEVFRADAVEVGAQPGQNRHAEAIRA
jgi:uroporphyrin-III C-methyltransferase/precorrin-2 dehydrogenase/sirohydrochlorin ferrochelatase